MTLDYNPEIQDINFNALPQALLESVLTRSIQYGFYELLLEFQDELIISSEKLDYKKKMEIIIKNLMNGTWFMIASEPADNGVPVFVFQKENTIVSISGGRAGNLQCIATIVSAGTKAELRFARKIMKNIVQ
ncbi:MAG: hypothetical protein ACTSUE_23270 [Promethearchaeota archaeon]